MLILLSIIYSSKGLYQKAEQEKIEKNGITYLDGSLLADVDNDIAYERRAEVISYIDKKHPGRTAKILTLNTLSGKLCVKECENSRRIY